MYEEAGVPYYFIADNIAEVHRFYGYQLTDDGYVEIEPNERGQVWMEPVQMWLDWHEKDNDLIKCYHDDGEPVLDSSEFKRLFDENEKKLKHAEMLAQQEAQRAEQEAQRAEQERLLREQEAQRADMNANLLAEERAELEKFKAYMRSVGIDPDSIAMEA